MKCMNCGTAIPENQMICPGCGQEVQIVPDYNPLDDVLAAQVKGAVSETMAIHLDQKERGKYNTSRTSYVKTGGRANTGRTTAGRSNTSRSNTSRNNTGRSSVNRNHTGRTGRVSPEERKMRQRKAEKKKMLARKKKKKMMIIGIVCALLAIIGGVFLYQNSYTGQVKKGYRLLASESYDEALVCFKKAVSKNEGRSEAYKGMADVYVAQEDLEKAELVFTNAVSEQPSNVEIYRAAVKFYIDTNQESKIPILLDECSSEKVLTELEMYISDVPEFSLDEDEEFDDVQSLELTGNGKAIYYTTDGTDPTTSSTKYTEMIKLDEGETEIRAISVNEKGIPSLIVSKTYTVEFPIEDAPSVTPSTGQYDSDQQIEVIVPDKYTAYYTTDGSNPDPENNPATIEYTGPIDMPEGNTIFSVVLVDQKGRISDVTKRNYELIYSE